MISSSDDIPDVDSTRDIKIKVLHEFIQKFIREIWQPMFTAYKNDVSIQHKFYILEKHDKNI